MTLFGGAAHLMPFLIFIKHRSIYLFILNLLLLLLRLHNNHLCLQLFSLPIHLLLFQKCAFPKVLDDNKRGGNAAAGIF